MPEGSEFIELSEEEALAWIGAWIGSECTAARPNRDGEWGFAIEFSSPQPLVVDSLEPSRLRHLGALVVSDWDDGEVMAERLAKLVGHRLLGVEIEPGVHTLTLKFDGDYQVELFVARLEDYHWGWTLPDESGVVAFGPGLWRAAPGALVDEGHSGQAS